MDLCQPGVFRYPYPQRTSAACAINHNGTAESFLCDCAKHGKIPLEHLSKDLNFITQASPEANEAASDGSPLYDGALPGEASNAIGAAKSGGALAQYTTDLTALAREGKIDPVLGRNHEINTMVDILLRRRQNNPLLTGDAGWVNRHC